MLSIQRVGEVQSLKHAFPTAWARRDPQAKKGMEMKRQHLSNSQWQGSWSMAEPVAFSVSWSSACRMQVDNGQGYRGVSRTLATSAALSPACWSSTVVSRDRCEGNSCFEIAVESALAPR